MPPNVWEEHVAAFQAAIQDAWQQHRLVPLIFRSAGRIAEGGSGARRLGGTHYYPSQWFWEPRAPNVNHLAREWGADIARDEVREFLSLLGETCPVDEGKGPIADQIDRTVTIMASRGLAATAIFAPARSSLLHEMNLEPPRDVSHLAALEARHWNRGSFRDIPVFAVQHPEADTLWVVDFRSLGTWLQPGAFDELFVHSELLRTECVELNGTMVPATAITALEYFAVEIEERRAAVGLRIQKPAAST